MRTSKTLFVAALATALIACHKGQVTPNELPVQLSYTFVNGAAPFALNTPFVDANGRTVRITKLKFYVHDVRISGSTGTVLAQLQDTIMLVDASNSTNQFSLGTMSAAQVGQVALAYGLDDASSYGYPDQVAAPYPLNVADMTWMWNTSAGRIFIKLEGFVDANANDVQDEGEGFQYHAIGASLEPQLTAVPYVHGMVLGTPFTIRLKVDVAQLVGTLGLNGMFHSDGAETHRLLENLASATERL